MAETAVLSAWNSLAVNWADFVCRHGYRRRSGLRMMEAEVADVECASGAESVSEVGEGCASDSLNHLLRCHVFPAQTS